MTLVSKFETCVTNYEVSQGAIGRQIKTLVTEGWYGQKGPAAFENYHTNWNGNQTDINFIITNLCKAVNLQTGSFLEWDTKAGGFGA